VESREHLRAAAETFTRLGAAPLAARATAELRAAGEASRRRDVDSLARLTPRELRIAQAVVEGNTTKDIAAMLFLSPRTVEYHLYKIFPKLGISSRADLVRLAAQDPELIRL
jgi:DNA-binding NarL/FixJ family response regulator